METETNEKGYSKIQWFLFVILIPLLFAITLSVGILTVAGVNVLELAKKYQTEIPIISTAANENEKEESNREQIDSLQATIENQKAAIVEYESEIVTKDEKISSLQSEIADIKEKLESARNVNENIKIKLENLADMYAGMSSRNAAAILTELDEKDATEILALMDNDERGAILAKMAPEKAATITKNLKSNE
jgi:flagellar protein FlbB